MALSVGSLSSCGKNEDTDENTEKFTVLIEKAEDSSFYVSYNDNPIVKFMEEHSSEVTGGKTLDFDFYSLTSGSEKDQFNTMISSGEYYDIIPLTYSNYSAQSLYEDEVIIDLTEYIDKYMPNYKKLLSTNEYLRRMSYITDTDGSKKIVTLMQVYDARQPNFEGLMYRRDWIVKYGTNPKTGAKFTSNEGDDPNNTYTDDVVFPSWYDETLKAKYLAIDSTWDGSYPVFISDWEWMFNIFTKAISSESNINKSKAYCFSLPYNGANASGDFFSGFGGGSPEWYKNGDVAAFGGTSEQMKSYIECLSTWYTNGWLDKTFNQRSSDMFYSIDTSSVHNGFVGAWNARRAEFGVSMRDAKNAPATAEIVAYGAPQPINDKYGAEETRFKVPDCYYTYSLVGSRFGITQKVVDDKKDLKALFTYLDYMYTDDFAFIRNGVDVENKYDFANNRIYKDEFYAKHNLPNGTYYVEERNGVEWMVKTKEAVADGYAHNAGVLNRFSLGVQAVAKVDYGCTKLETETYTLWGKYDTPAYILNYTDLMSSDESSSYAKVKNNVETYMYQTVPEFIMGKKTLSNDWAGYVSTLNKYAPQKVSNIYTAILERTSA